MGEENNKVSVLGVLVNPINAGEIIRDVISRAKEQKKTLVSYVNAHNLIVANRDEHYRTLINQYDMVYPDGFGTVMAARVLGHEFPPRSTSADFFMDLFGSFAEEGVSVYLLGAKPGVMERSSERIRERYPDVNIAGLHHGYFGAEEEGAVIDEINRLRPHVLFVSTGVPHQEKWIDRNLSKLHVPVIWASGGVFDFVSGATKRAPQWMNDYGLEWLYRLIVEPKRLWRRYLIGNPVFLFLVAKYYFRRER